MPLIFGGTKYKGITLTGDRALETYAENTPPPADVQRGRVYFANGKKYVGTGKCFETAIYGRTSVKRIVEINGEKKYGAEIIVANGVNLIIIAPYEGDLLLQETIFVDLLTEDEPVIIGVNKTTNDNIYAFYKNDRLYIYLGGIENINSKFYYFTGKDNEI